MAAMSGSARKTMIFHVPFRLNPQATSASGIRPVRMRRAFEELGYEVIEISGHHAERRLRMREVLRRVRDGLDVDFVYSEAATTPTGLGEPVTRHTSLSRDVRFLRSCRRRGIPVGLFYRDIYWQNEEYAQRVGQPYTALLRHRYHADLRGYRTAVDRLFVPSMRMAEVIPHIDRAVCLALPPASDIVDAGTVSDPATMFYVGALGHYYQLHEAVRAFESIPDAALTICTSEALWAAERSEYEPLMHTGTTRIVHASGAALEPFYQEAALGCLFMAPIGYREFAAPMKLYEYLGHGRPIVATEGSLAAEFVAEHGIGWVLPYRSDALRQLLLSLRAEPERYRTMAARAREVRASHTWTARAAQAADALLELSA